MSREQAYAAGRADAHTAPLHDLNARMDKLGIPLNLTGAYLAGIEDELGWEQDA